MYHAHTSIQQLYFIKRNPIKQQKMHFEMNIFANRSDYYMDNGVM